MDLRVCVLLVSAVSILPGPMGVCPDVAVAETKGAVRKEAASPQAGGPQDLDYILKKYVDGEFFKYKELKANKKDHARFEQFMEWQANADVKAMSREDQVAFYINAYNSCSIKAILDHYPVHTPLDVDGFFDKLKFKVGGEMLKLGGFDGVRPADRQLRRHAGSLCCRLCRPRMHVAQKRCVYRHESG